MPYCPICEKCLYSSSGRKGSDRKYQLGSNLRRHKALRASGNTGNTGVGVSGPRGCCRDGQNIISTS